MWPEDQSEEHFKGISRILGYLEENRGIKIKSM